MTPVPRATRERKRWLLDLYCKAGGATKGYQRAGFHVVGVDKDFQPNYCGDEFWQHDALDLDFFPPAWLERFSAVHASPPCQFATDYIRTGNVGESPNLIPPTRELLQATGLPYVIENVSGARWELHNPTMLCGSAFGLDIRRHRYFETNFPLMAPGCAHGQQAPNRFPGGRSKERTGSNRGLCRATVEIGTWDIPLDVQQRAMGMDWTTLEELSEAVPPAFTEWIGAVLLAYLQTEQKAAA